MFAPLAIKYLFDAIPAAVTPIVVMRSYFWNCSNKPFFDWKRTGPVAMFNELLLYSLAWDRIQYLPTKVSASVWSIISLFAFEIAYRIASFLKLLIFDCPIISSSWKTLRLSIFKESKTSKELSVEWSST